MRKISSLLLALTVTITACDWDGGERVKGNGNIASQERSVNEFSRLEVHGSIDVHVSQGPSRPIRIEGDENLLSYIELRENGDRLEIRSREGFNLRPTRDMKVFVTAPSFSEIDVSGACDIIGETLVSNRDRLRLEVSGAGDINMEVDVPVLSANISGSGSMLLKGKTRDFSCGLSGAGTAKCFDLMAENVKVDISGAGDADVYASMKLDAKVSGAGSVKYKGNTESVSQNISGAGSIKKAD